MSNPDGTPAADSALSSDADPAAPAWVVSETLGLENPFKPELPVHAQRVPFRAQIGRMPFYFDPSLPRPSEATAVRGAGYTAGYAQG